MHPCFLDEATQLRKINHFVLINVDADQMLPDFIIDNL